MRRVVVQRQRLAWRVKSKVIEQGVIIFFFKQKTAYEMIW